MIDLHYWPTPNGWKITIMLEECGLPYRVVPVNIGRGEQFTAAFQALNPNGRMPAIVDHDPLGGDGPLAIFESGAILLYLAEKTSRFMPSDIKGRYRVTQWLMWQMGGLGPMLGQNGHFALYAAEKIPYAIDRYGREAHRLYAVLDGELGRTNDCIAGAYSIADMATFPWIMTHKAQGISLDDYPNIKRWYAQLRGREALQRGLAVGKEWRAPKMDDEARQVLFGAPPQASPRS
ncbi:glutathione S-transferase family protein [Bradyrhizobium sp. 2TAF24]|uniref:glutathione S-transferase family protein n=1 Tax=Bradyrhizobium sp. 2TAF24 TaxID=3233011 RepID=UPI003F8F8A5C